MVGDPDYASLVETIYSAASDVAQWPAVLERLSRSFGCPSAVLTLQDSEARSGSRYAYGYEPADVTRYFAGYSVQNPLFDRLVQQGVGVPLLTQTAVDSQELKRSFYYREWLKPRDIFYCIGLVLSKDEDQTHWISFNRPERSEGFGPDHARLIAALVPHLLRTAGITRHLGRISGHHAAAEAVLNGIWQALILLDERRNAVFLNTSAHKLLTRKDGIDIIRGRVTCTAADKTAEIEALIARAANDLDGQGRRGGEMMLPRRSPRAPLIAVVAPLLDEANVMIVNRPTVALIIIDPDAAKRVPEDLVRRAFGLTRAEARLARLLGNGCALSDASALLGVGRETARTHLAHILSKTGATRQADLVRLLAAATPAIELM